MKREVFIHLGYEDIVYNKETLRLCRIISKFSQPDAVNDDQMLWTRFVFSESGSGDIRVGDHDQWELLGDDAPQKVINTYFQAKTDELLRQITELKWKLGNL